MNKTIVNRVLQEAHYIIKTESTVRDMALIFKVSKSTVHKDLHERLFYIDKKLFGDVKKILNYHSDIKHIRGGNSTKEKYLNMENMVV